MWPRRPRTRSPTVVRAWVEGAYARVVRPPRRDPGADGALAGLRSRSPRSICDDRDTMADELSPSEVARRLGTSTRTVQRWIESGKLPARRVGGRWRVANVAFDAFERRAADADGRTAARSGASSSPTAARSRHGSRGRATGSGSRAIVPATDGPDALDLLDIEAVVAAARGRRRRCGPPRVRVPGRERRLRRGGRRRRADAGSGHRRPRSGRWATRPPPAGSRPRSASRVLPGYDDPDQSDAALTAAAERIGYPAAGQAVRRWRRQGDADRSRRGRAPRCARSARREATAAFGDDRLILERLVEGGRHVEIQVLFDARRATASTSASATARSSAATRRCSRRRRRPASMPPSAPGSARRR